jgi:hypothetical protein
LQKTGDTFCHGQLLIVSLCAARRNPANILANFFERPLRETEMRINLCAIHAGPLQIAQIPSAHENLIQVDAPIYGPKAERLVGSKQLNSSDKEPRCYIEAYQCSSER